MFIYLLQIIMQVIISSAFQKGAFKYNLHKCKRFT